jgi:multiple sugar transport system permease protein
VKTDLSRRASTWVFLSPWVLTFAVFGLFPILFSFALSFLRYDPLNPAATSAVGLSNYVEALGDRAFWKSLANTGIFTLGTIPFTTAFAFLLALALDRRLPARGVFRAGFFVPSVVSMVVISLVWKNLYAPFGALNAGLRAVGLGGVAWLQDPRTALPAIMAMDVWASVGYYMLLFLAGLQSVPKELHEAAALDGAGAWARVRHVTIPMLRPITLFVLVINTIRSLQVFIEVFVMTRGGPMNATLTTVFYLYDVGFFKFRMGYASAIAYLLFVLILGFSIVEMRALRRRA